MVKKVDCEKLCPEWPCDQPEEFRDIWVVMETDEHGISEAKVKGRFIFIKRS